MKDKEVIISTERCVLAVLDKDDISEAAELFTNERVRLFLGGVISEKQARNKLNRWVSSQDNLYLSIRRKDTGSFIGIVSISGHHDNDFKELSYQFLPDFWGNGFAYETINTLLKYVRTSNTYTDLIAEMQSNNVKSCKLLTKLGFELVRVVNRFDVKQNIYRISLI